MLSLIKTLLGSIVDYAGLYPPAQLDLRSAMQIYAESAASPNAWMLSRFVLPAVRLEEFSLLLPEFSLAQWSLSLVIKSLAELEQALQIEASQSDRFQIAALEFTPRSPAEVESLIPQVPPNLDVFFEIPLDDAFGESIAVLKGTSAAAKVRTGGITPSAIPSSSQLAQWIHTCAQTRVPFKATAGLHHPFPGAYRLTYEANSPTALMQGFLTLAIAAAFAYHQTIEQEEIVQLLEINTLTDTLQFQPDCLIWNSRRGKRQLELQEIQTARQHFCRSFGSCSFQEPIDDLKKLGLIHP